MNVQDIYAVAKHLGGIVAQSRNAMPALAIAAAKSARASRIDEDDANGIYSEYSHHSLERVVDQTCNSFKANASKLRTLIKCALEHEDTLRLLERVTEEHHKARKMKDVTPLYDAMVTVCRWRLERGTTTASDIDKVLAR